MNRLESIYDLTLELKKLLDEPMTAKSREAVITDLNRILIKRGVEMENINAPLSTEEQNLGKKLVPINEAVQKKMQVMFTDLKTEMKQVKQQKKSNQSYINPYKSVQAVDGMFMDRKK
ncbi:flagellar protein FliT [Oceanobacillus chungangensis]|uniref:Flagellar protein FliT n=1 Tax=Oceanobacillus chungangensis TaxID=1229152 RepID=A0A3D8PJ37_9BACI|nr:flagellar protein FliT [Oceanobacillus chungangensis]RDW15672.1 flagellar protein FliT [Oceanobacillus chungangensis]